MQQTGGEMFSKAITHITWYLKMPPFFLVSKMMTDVWRYAKRGAEIKWKGRMRKNVELQDNN